jgi:tripartite-type tricarboxylate transporter receptor subunit TctC
MPTRSPPLPPRRVGGLFQRAAALAAVAMLTATAAPASAEDAFPSGPIRLIIPFSAGGAADFVGRVTAEALSAELGTPVVVENRVGASGVIGSEMVATAPADGYTLLQGSVGTHATARALISNLPYDPEADFAPISLLAFVPAMLVATKSLPVATPDELVAYARAHPGTVNFASAGLGTNAHLAGELLNVQAGIDMVHVPYRGFDQLVPDLVAGQSHIAFVSINAVLGQVLADTVTPLAVSLPERWPALPDVPTFAEAGLPDIEVSSWLILAAPAGTPAAVVSKLEAALVSVLAKEEVRQRFFDSGNFPVGGDAASARAHVEEQIQTWGEIIRLAGLEAQ